MKKRKTKEKEVMLSFWFGGMGGDANCAEVTLSEKLWLEIKLGRKHVFRQFECTEDGPIVTEWTMDALADFQLVVDYGSAEEEDWDSFYDQDINELDVSGTLFEGNFSKKEILSLNRSCL